MWVLGVARRKHTCDPPSPCVATSVIDVHTTNVCEYVNSLSSLERYSCVVNLALFCFCFFCFCFFFSVFFFSFLFGSLGCFLFPFSPPLLLFMKLENLKDCCVFVNNKNYCALRACKCPLSKLLLLEPVSPMMWSVFDVPSPPV